MTKQRSRGSGGDRRKVMCVSARGGTRKLGFQTDCGRIMMPLYRYFLVGIKKIDIDISRLPGAFCILGGGDGVCWATVKNGDWNKTLGLVRFIKYIRPSNFTLPSPLRRLIFLISPLTHTHTLHNGLSCAPLFHQNYNLLIISTDKVSRDRP